MLQNVAHAGFDMVNGVWDFFLNVEPHGFGLMLVPLIVLGAISLWAARKPQAR
jgi:hypothetical protein